MTCNFTLHLCHITCCIGVIHFHRECPAGKGPHGTCKHIVAELLMLTTFAAEKLMLSHSCIDELQTFHRPKRKHGGKVIF